jgi:hypothetical protein
MVAGISQNGGLQMKRFIFALAMLPGMAMADDIPGIQNHDVQKRFMKEPCGAVVGAIDNAPATPEGVGTMAMTFGFLMGVEALNPGIRGTRETILTRLRTDCAIYPEKTAMELLTGYANE